LNTTKIGQTAEAQVAEHLRKKGHKIISQNWRCEVAEIDLITKYRKCIFFIEVKYRNESHFGYGLEFIDSPKLIQLKKGVLAWCQQHKYSGQLRVLGAGVGGESDELNLVEIYFE
jgi:putative endonuclease